LVVALLLFDPADSADLSSALTLESVSPATMAANSTKRDTLNCIFGFRTYIKLQLPSKFHSELAGLEERSYFLPSFAVNPLIFCS